MKTMKYIMMLAAVLSFCPAGFAFTGSSYSGTYVDAGDTNTVARDGITPWYSTSNNPGWTRRAFANNLTIFENDGGSGKMGDAPVLKTTISGLNPYQPYEAWVVFWSGTLDGGHNWKIFAGLTSQPQTLYTKTNSRATGGLDSDRREYEGAIGLGYAAADGTLPVYIDDNTQSDQFYRTWYDGVVYALRFLAFRPTPADGAVSIPTNQVLSFESKRDPNNPAQEDPNLMSHKVYLDDDPNLADAGDLIATLPKATKQVSPTLDYNKKYYWRVDEVLDSGTVITGQVWTFETIKTVPNFNPPYGTQPVSVAVFPENDAVLQVSAGVGSYNYQWYKGASGVTANPVANDTGHISGADTNTLTIKAQVADDGLYWCYAQNPQGTANSNAAAITVKRLLAHWKLDGDPNDSANGYHGTLVGSPAFETNGINGQAMIFDGSDDVIELPDAFSNFAAGVTYYVWAKPTTAANWARFIDLAESYSGTSTTGDDNVFLARNSTSANLTFEVWKGAARSAAVTATDAITLNEWQMFAATLDEAGNVVLYKNGLQIQTGSSGLPDNVIRSSGFIGKSNWSADALYAGQMDDVRIYNYARDGYDVAADYVAFVPETVICVEYPEFDVAGPAGAGEANRDCKVNLYDFAELARHWLECNNVPASGCL